MTAISGTRRAMREMADGTLRVQVDIDPQYRSMFLQLFGEIDMPVALVPLNAGFDQPAQQEHGEHQISVAQELHRHGFFNSPAVLMELGTDKQFIEYTRTLKCKVCGAGPRSEAAHVRRIAEGAGVSIKPPYSTIPLCHEHHHAQHQRGESAIGGKEQADKWLADVRSDWGHAALRHALEVESMKEVGPDLFMAWARVKGLEAYVPRSIRLAAEGKQHDE